MSKEREALRVCGVVEVGRESSVFLMGRGESACVCVFSPPLSYEVSLVEGEMRRSGGSPGILFPAQWWLEGVGCM